MPRRQCVLALRHLDTASCLVPLAANRAGRWGLHSGGDWAFFESLLPLVSGVRVHRLFTFRYLLGSSHEEQEDD